MDAKAEEFLEQLASTKDEITPEDVDSFLAAQDPEFAAKMGEMSKDKGLSIVESEVDEETSELHDEIAKWNNSSGLKKKLVGIFPFLPRLTVRLNRIAFRFFAMTRAIGIHGKDFYDYLRTDGRKNLKKFSIALYQATFGLISRALEDFGNLSTKLKFALFGMILLFVGAVFLFYFALKGKVWPAETELFLTSLDSHASVVYQVKEEEGFENFYDNIRATPNLLLIQKLVVNIKPSANSGKNPMMACELFLDALSPDVIIEVKDRETFFRDLIQRASEEFDFDTLSSTGGKKEYLKTIMKDINRQLTTGELRNIRIKTIVIKP